MANLDLAQEHLSGDNEDRASAAFYSTYPNVSCQSRDLSLWSQSSFLEPLGQRCPLFFVKSLQGKHVLCSVDVYLCLQAAFSMWL